MSNWLIGGLVFLAETFGAFAFGCLVMYIGLRWAKISKGDEWE